MRGVLIRGGSKSLALTAGGGDSSALRYTHIAQLLSFYGSAASVGNLLWVRRILTHAC